MIAQCWLHIGTEKTGSTSIRRYLVHNRDALREQGYLYPKSPGFINHYALTAFGLDDRSNDGMRRSLGLTDASVLADFRQKFADELTAELAADNSSNVILSNELLSSRLRTQDEVMRVKSLCDRIARNTRVVVYLRNQVDFLVSRYTNVMWAGGKKDFGFGKAPIADYGALLDRWAAVFGRDNIVARRFEQADFFAGDLLSDFACTLGLDHTRLESVPRLNESLDAESLAFVRALNRLPPKLAWRIGRMRGHIVRILQRRRGGTEFVIPPALAARIENAFRASNERVSELYFESRFQPLFSPPLLVGSQEARRRDTVGPFSAARITAFLLYGVVRDAVKPHPPAW